MARVVPRNGVFMGVPIGESGHARRASHVDQCRPNGPTCQQNAAHFSALERFFHFGDLMKSDLATSAAKVAPAVGSNFWLWLTGHDINWWVAVATIAYIGLQAYYLVKNKGKRALLDG